MPIRCASPRPAAGWPWRPTLPAILLALALHGAVTPGTAAERDVVNTSVPVVQPDRMALATPSGQMEVPIAVSRDWTQRQDDVTRVVIVIHGWPRRDLRAGERAARAAGDVARQAIVITPQFLTAKDIDAHQLPATLLRWRENDWQKGEPSHDAAAITSFQVLDAIVHRLADRARFPNLATIVLAGHSAGGQFIQRYAAIGHAEAQLGAAPIHLRYVVANPASYLYFTPDRPMPKGGLAFFATTTCPRFDRWPYGLQTGIPTDMGMSPAALQARYLQRDVVYLLGTADDDPQADGLDRSCAGEVEGPTRLARGLAYAAYVRRFDPATKQHVLEVPGIGHQSTPMFSSACGLAALFDKPGCDTAAP